MIIKIPDKARTELLSRKNSPKILADPMGVLSCVAPVVFIVSPIMGNL
jgi:hypothetical protein